MKYNKIYNYGLVSIKKIGKDQFVVWNEITKVQDQVFNTWEDADTYARRLNGKLKNGTKDN